jgi:hypothetical protein
VVDDVARLVEHGQVQQPAVHQVEDVEDASGSAVAVLEGVDGLELVVD